VNLDLDFCKPFKSFSPGHDECDLSEPVHITARLIEMSAPARLSSSEELVRRWRNRNFEPQGRAFIFCNSASASFLTSTLKLFQFFKCPIMR
jgi:hypothetical protein